MVNLFKSNIPNVEGVVHELLKKLQVKVSYTTIANSLQDHPEFPSLLSISDYLTEWGVTNQAYKIDLSEFDTEDLYFPFIAHFSENGGSYRLVNKIDNGKVYCTNENSKAIELSQEEFLKRWRGIALHGTANAENGEANYKESRFREFLSQLLMPTAFISFIGILFLVFSNLPFNGSLVLLSVFKITGIGLSILLLMQSLNANNPFIQNLCSLGGKNDCNAILKSDAAK